MNVTDDIGQPGNRDEVHKVARPKVALVMRVRVRVSVRPVRYGQHLYFFWLLISLKFESFR